MKHDSRCFVVVLHAEKEQYIARRKDKCPPAEGTSTKATYRWCIHLANASEKAPAMASLLFWATSGGRTAMLTNGFDF